MMKSLVFQMAFSGQYNCFAELPFVLQLSLPIDTVSVCLSQSLWVKICFSSVFY